MPLVCPFAFGCHLIENDNFGVVRMGRSEGVHHQLPESAGESDLLFERDGLLAKEEDEMLVKRVLERFDRRLGQFFSKVEA